MDPRSVDAQQVTWPGLAGPPTPRRSSLLHNAALTCLPAAAPPPPARPSACDSRTDTCPRTRSSLAGDMSRTDPEDARAQTRRSSVRSSASSASPSSPSHAAVHWCMSPAPAPRTGVRRSGVPACLRGGVTRGVAGTAAWVGVVLTGVRSTSRSPSPAPHPCPPGEHPASTGAARPCKSSRVGKSSRRTALTRPHTPGRRVRHNPGEGPGSSPDRLCPRPTAPARPAPLSPVPGPLAFPRSSPFSASRSTPLASNPLSAADTSVNKRPMAERTLAGEG